jgi:formate dehydrogenase major subunit
MSPLVVAGKVVHQIGMPFHWGPNGYAKGDAVNELVAMAVDPNVHIQESKVLKVDITPGRRPRGAALLDLVARHRERAGVTVDTGHQI